MRPARASTLPRWFGGRSRLRWAPCLLALALTTGCAALAPLQPAERVYSGRFAASFVRGEQQDSLSGRFTLAVDGGATTLDLASPLGNTLARLRMIGSQVTLTAPQADGSLRTWEGAGADGIAEAALGFRLPASGLIDWIEGRPIGGRPAKVAPDDGPLRRIEQDGWVISIDERFDRGGPPRRLTFERNGGAVEQGSIRLRLVLDEPARPSAGPAQ